jgi:hypothetical protein
VFSLLTIYSKKAQMLMRSFPDESAVFALDSFTCTWKYSNDKS